MRRASVNWKWLVQRHAPSLVEIVKQLFADGSFEISVDLIASQANCPKEDVAKILSELCPPLDRTSAFSCPNCDIGLSDGEALLEVCPNCHQQYVEHGGVRVSQMFAYHAACSRDVIWVLALHGMNTRGAWQEELNWRVSTAYSRSVPVAIYKYGWVTVGAIWRRSLRRKVEEVSRKILKLKGDTELNGFAGPPDVIAHSLGTWLIGHALMSNPSLKIGRAVLTGSILRPDFDWGELIARGQVEAVLNHYGTKDFWAQVAQYVIPDSGPSGRYGFNSSVLATQVRADGFGHSDVFKEQNIPIIFETVWRPFLTGPIEDLETITDIAHEDWKPMPWVCRATILPVIIFAVFCGLLAILACCSLVGFYEVVRKLRF